MPVMTDQSETGVEYRPVPASRRGEASAWLFFGILLAAVIFLQRANPPVSPAILLLMGFFFLVAIVISFGNWMDRKTSIRISDDFLIYRNGLRTVTLRWNEIKEIQLYEDRLGEKALVLGENTHFGIRLFGEVHYKGEKRGVFGFQEGKEILRLISERSAVKPVRTDR